jgi:hypothetical protein
MGMGNVIAIKGAQHAPRASSSKMETLILTQPMVNEWRVPPFQRPLRINCKIQAVTEAIRHSEVVEGVLTLGTLKTDQVLYIVDGQHRIEAFRLSGLKEAIADVRIVVFANMAEMAEEFVQLNSSLVRMRPDDILRGLESSVPVLKQIRKSCEFVGYDQVRRGTYGPIVSMSALLRCWSAAQYETPSPKAPPGGAAGLAQAVDEKSLANLIAFLSTAHAAWGRDPEYYRLWGNLNLAVCMWLWNKLVIDRERTGNKRYAVLDIPKFKKCLMSLSADTNYLPWLLGRNLSDRDRSPCYTKIRDIFGKRLLDETGKRPNFPQPAWLRKTGHPAL